MRTNPPPLTATPESRPSRRQLERDIQHRVGTWLTTSVITWVIWALAGAPTGLPHGTGGPHHHLFITLGIWPAYIMFCGLLDVAKRSYRLYAQPLIDEEDGLAAKT